MRRYALPILLGISLLANGVLLVWLSRGPSAAAADAATPPTVQLAATVAPPTASPTTRPTRPPAISTNAPPRQPTEEPTTEPTPTTEPSAVPELTPTTEPTPTVVPSPTALPSPTPEPQPSPTIVALDADWLRYLNIFRDAARLPPLREDSAWSAESGLHSRYMVLTGDVGHSEQPGSPYFTQVGNAAGDTGNIAIGNLSSAPYEWAFNYWMSAPFHAVPMLDPQLSVTGFGEYRDVAGVLQVSATLDVERGRGPLPDNVHFPIYWPGDGSTTWVLRYSLPEFPAALSHCTGYVQATGAPIILQLGDGRLTPNVTATTLLRDGEPLAHCQFDETNYTHPDAWTQRSARQILAQRDAVVIIPYAPMTPDATYAVRVDANGQTYTWSFRTAAGPPAK